MPDSLARKLALARRRWRTLLAFAGVCLAFTILAFLCLTSFYTDRLIVLTYSGRLAWLTTLVAGLILGFGAAAVIAVRRRIRDNDVAGLVERRFPVLGERLLTTVELSQAGHGSQSLTAQIARETERISNQLDFSQAVPRHSARKAGITAAFTAALLLLHVVIAPQAMAVWARRILNPRADIPVYARTLIWVSPDDKVLPRGEPLDIAVKVSGRVTDRARLHYRYDGAQWSVAELTNPKNSKFAFRIPEALQSITFYATAGDGQSNAHTVRVEDRPAILSLKLGFTYPAYTHKPAGQIVVSTGNIAAPPGTRIHVTAIANKPLGSAEMVQDGKRTPCRVENASTGIDLTVRKDANYSIHVKDHNGFADLTPPQYTIHTQPDRTPQVQIDQPGGDVERTAAGALPLKVTANDDYGVESVSLGYSVGKRSGSLPLPGANGLKETVSNAVWNLGALNLKPGDTVTYEARARDGDTVSGPHVGKSASYRVHILSDAEMRERLEAEKARQREALKLLLEQQKAAEADLAKAHQKPDRAAQAAQAQQSQRSVAQETAELAKQMAQTDQQLKDNGLQQTTDPKREETRQALDKLAQKDMPQAADSIQKGQLSSATQQEQAIRNELERLNQLAAPARDPSQLAETADKLAQEQQQLADKSDAIASKMENRAATPDEKAQLNKLAAKQTALQKETQALSNKLSRAADEAKAESRPNASSLEKAASSLQKAGTNAKQSSAQKNLQSGKPSEASPSQNQAAEDLQNLANQLDQAGQQSNSDNLEKRAQKLEELADKLSEMAEQQRDVAMKAIYSRTPDNKALQAKEQDLLNQAKEIMPQLSDAPGAQQSLGMAQRELTNASEQFSKNSAQGASGPAQQARRQLYNAAMEARNAARAMDRQQASSEMRQKVEQIARDQRAINRQTNQIDKTPQDKRGTPDFQKKAQETAEKQSKLTEKTGALGDDAPSPGFGAAMNEAVKRMENARAALDQKNTGEEAQRNQRNAANLLERIARALKKDEQAAQQSASQGGNQNGANSGADQAQADAELQLARELQAQIRQETGSLDKRRDKNPGRQMTAEQQRELDSLRGAEREAQRIAEGAMKRLRANPDIAKTVGKATETMEDIRDMLQKAETGEPTQTKEDQTVGMLDRAIRQTRQAIRDQRQQQQASGQQQQKPGQQSASGQRQPGGNQPAQKTTAPIVQAKEGAKNAFDPRGRGFGALPPKLQQALREGRMERVPAEYRELVNQYYKALSERR